MANRKAPLLNMFDLLSKIYLNTRLYTLKYLPRSIHAHFTLIVSGRNEDRTNPMSQIISFQKQLYLGEFETRLHVSCVQVKNHYGEYYTRRK